MATFEVTKDLYFQKTQPNKSEELANIIQITTQPLEPAAATETVFSSKDPVSIDGSGSVTLEAIYSKVPVTEAAAAIVDPSVSGIIVSSASYYSWGARVTIVNENASAGTFKLQIDGKPLSVISPEVVESSDSDSILEYGTQMYQLPNNHLIQSKGLAETISSILLSSYKINRKDVSVEWRQNPALDLTDEIEVPDYQKNSVSILGVFRVIRNKVSYDGTLRGTTEGRRIA